MKIMEMCLSFIVVLVLSASLPATKAEEFVEGSGCFNHYHQERGLCVPLSRCQSAQNDLRSGNSDPQLCFYQGREPVVCCPCSRQRDSVVFPYWRVGCSGAAQPQQPGPMFVPHPVYHPPPSVSSTPRPVFVPSPNFKPIKPQHGVHPLPPATPVPQLPSDFSVFHFSTVDHSKTTTQMSTALPPAVGQPDVQPVVDSSPTTENFPLVTEKAPTASSPLVPDEISETVSPVASPEQAPESPDQSLESLAGESPDQVSGSPDQAPESPDEAPPSPNQTDHEPSTPGDVSPSPDPAPETPEVPASPETVPLTQDLAPESPDEAPESPGQIPSSPEPAPESPEAPASPDDVPESPDQASGTPDEAPSSPEDALESPDPVPAVADQDYSSSSTASPGASSSTAFPVDSLSLDSGAPNAVAGDYPPYPTPPAYGDEPVAKQLALRRGVIRAGKLRQRGKK